MTHRLQAQARIDTPLGALTLAATTRGLALAWFDDQAHRSAEVDAPLRPDDPHLALAAREFAAYWRDAQAPFTVALDPAGTPFQLAAWRALRGIAPGKLSTYGDVALRVGQPSALRAIGAAIGRNPLSIVVPCHRVIGRDGSLTGYAGGLPRKRALLQHEGCWPAQA